jgi:hypothetical protein
MPKTPKITEEELCARLALVLVETGMRNSRLEDLHAGISPDSAIGDYSDVKVVTPYGEIPWSRVSRLDDEEMKALMMEVVDRVYTILTHPDASWRLIGAARWDKPKLSPALMGWVRKMEARQRGVPDEMSFAKRPHEEAEPLPPIRREQRAAAYEAELDKPHEQWSFNPTPDDLRALAQAPIADADWIAKAREALRLMAERAPLALRDEIEATAHGQD